jgi:Fe-S-cluster containining protein
MTLGAHKITVVELHSEPSKQCVGCGSCCKSAPGAYHPTDFTSYQELKDLVVAGKAVLNYWEGFERKSNSGYEGYFVEPSLKTRYRKWGIVDPHWGGECINLTEEGCSLPREKMPSMCKLLRPRQTENHRCAYDNEEYTKETVASLWEEKREWIDNLLEELQDND